MGDGEYVRLTFKQPLDSVRDITLYAAPNYSSQSSTDTTTDKKEIQEEASEI